MLSERETMNHIPPAALVIAMALLLVIGFFLAHMISSQEQDARLEFFLHLLEALPASGGKSRGWWERGSLPGESGATVRESPLAVRNVARETGWGPGRLHDGKHRGGSLPGCVAGACRDFWKSPGHPAEPDGAGGSAARVAPRSPPVRKEVFDPWM
jgi:hypothetical protein